MIKIRSKLGPAQCLVKNLGKFDTGVKILVKIQSKLYSGQNQVKIGAQSNSVQNLESGWNMDSNQVIFKFGQNLVKIGI